MSPNFPRSHGLQETRGDSQHVLEVARIAYTEDDMPVETVINVFPSQQWRLSYEWAAELVTSGG